MLWLLLSIRMKQIYTKAIQMSIINNSFSELTELQLIPNIVYRYLFLSAYQVSFGSDFVTSLINSDWKMFHQKLSYQHHLQIFMFSSVFPKAKLLLNLFEPVSFFVYRISNTLKRYLLVIFLFYKPSLFEHDCHL